MKYNIGDKLKEGAYEHCKVVGVFFDNDCPANSYYRVKVSDTKTAVVKALSVEKDNPIYHRAKYKVLLREDKNLVNELKKNARKIIIPEKINRYKKGDIIKYGQYEGYKIVSFDINMDNIEQCSYTIQLRDKKLKVDHSFVDNGYDNPPKQVSYSNKDTTYSYEYLKEHKDIPVIEVAIYNESNNLYEGSYYYANVDRHPFIKGSLALAKVKRPSKNKWFVPCKIIKSNVEVEEIKDTILGICEGTLENIGVPIQTNYKEVYNSMKLNKEVGI